MEQARPIAYLALLLVVPFAILAVATQRLTRAVLLVTLGSLLFLPEKVEFDAPLIPPMDKESLPALCLMIGLLVAGRERIRIAKIGRGIDWVLALALLVTVGTVLTNRDALRYGETVLPGYTNKDLFSEAVRTVLVWAIPFLLGRTLFRTAEDARDLLGGVAIGGILYAPFILVELRMSPQWHNWIYGFQQHSFGQTIRDGGYRPMVFMAHGLAMALFLWAAGHAAWTLAKARRAIFGISARPFAVGLSVLLALVNSLGALVYGVVSYPLSWFLRPKAQLRFAALIALVVALYPALRATGTFPRQELVDLAARVSQHRAQSLDFRFLNEELLIDKALERPYFGWGSFGRNRYYDAERYDRSVTDGGWILVLGIRGVVGFAVYFSLLLLPVWNALRRVDRVPRADQPLLAGAAVIAAIYTLDLLPNGFFNTLPVFFSGAVMGLSQGMVDAGSRRFDPELVARWIANLRRPSVTATAARASRIR